MNNRVFIIAELSAKLKRKNSKFKIKKEKCKT